MFGHVARFVLPLADGGKAGDALRASVVFVTDHTVGATSGGDLLLFARDPFRPVGRWPWAAALRNELPRLDQPRLDPAAVLSHGRMLFLLSGYQDGQPSFVGIPMLFDPTRVPAFVVLRGRRKSPFPLARTSVRRVHVLRDGSLALAAETRVSALFHVETDATVEGACRLDLATGCLEELDALPRGARPHDSGHFYARGFGISLCDEDLFGPPPWGSDADAQIADGFVTVTPAENGKPLPELALRGPCANRSFQPGPGRRGVTAGRRGRSLFVLDATPEDRIVVDLWELA